MAYIGREPVIGNFVKLDAITVVNGQAAYTMNNGGSAFTAYDNVNQFLVSLNGILQSPTDSFTVSGSTLTFASNLSTGDVIDFVIVLGNSLDIGTPSDNTVTAAKLNDDIISGSTELASEPADTDEFLVSDAGTLKRIDYSLIKGGGSVVQTKFLNETATYSAGSSSFVDLGNLSLAITPTSSSNKILVHISIGRAQGGDNSTIFRFTRNGTAVGIGDSVGSRGQASFGMLGENYSNGAHADNHSFTFIDSPSSTSALTYKLQQANEGGGTTYYNRAKSYSDSSGLQHVTAHTTFILQEIVAWLIMMEYIYFIQM